MKKLIVLLIIAGGLFYQPVQAQDLESSKEAWVPDLGNGKYKNPIIFADYSDPDVCRVGDDYYLVASSFDAVPGLPILHSKDLVNWTIIGHALMRHFPYDHFSKTQHGEGVWAPSIRYHNDSFYVYYGDPDFGIYMVRAKDPAGPWTKPFLVKAGKGLIDPSPLWDDKGKAYLVHAFAGSRAGINNILTVTRMNSSGTKALGEGVIVYDGRGVDRTTEGPKFYKRNGYYYIFAPAGGVSHGYQIVLRSKNVYGPYQRKLVMHQGETSINGPHQGGWVTTPDGEQSWFIHFRDMEAYGRVTYLEPMEWVNDWPVIGEDKDGDGVGEPVAIYKKPDVGQSYPLAVPQTSDDFNDLKLGLQWQWQANPQATWMYMTGKGTLRLYAQRLKEDMKNYWTFPSILMQKFPADQFQVTTKLKFHPSNNGDKVGFMVMGEDYAYLSLTNKEGKLSLSFSTCEGAIDGNAEKVKTLGQIKDDIIYFRVTVKEGAVCHFSYSLDGENFEKVDATFTAKPGHWIGAKIGLFCSSIEQEHNSGYADFDWIRVRPVK
ncbi:MAG TPA: glycoside hydrolase 43 family protein [Chitinophagaceae bacterium]|nr:glycoside hydrolase 43 family protein [Chitinophagaceae bacterium]